MSLNNFFLKPANNTFRCDGFNPSIKEGIDLKLS